MTTQTAIWANKNKEDSGYTLWASPHPEYDTPKSLVRGLESLSEFEKENTLKPGEGAWLCPLYNWELAECIIGHLNKGEIRWTSLKWKVLESLEFTAQELMSERPEMVESVIDLILADTISTLVESEEDYSHLCSLFIQSGEDIFENYKDTKKSLNLSAEYQSLHSLVEQVIDNIGSDLFTDMLDTDKNSTYSEILRCFGHGVSFWDNNDYKDFGFSEMPQLRTILEPPYDIATQILDKIAEAHPELVEADEESDNVTTYQIPTIYLPLIFNDDATGLKDEDIELFDEFIEREGLNHGHWSYPDNEESYFSPDNDVFNLGADVMDLQWVDISSKDTSTKDNDFDIWLATNYLPAGEHYYLSANPNNFLMYELQELKDKYHRTEAVKQYKVFHLVVENNKTHELLYHRELTDETILDIPDYLPEIEQATGLQFSLIPFGSIFAGDGQIGINITFSKPPSHNDDDSVWEYEDYRLV
jgi:hypothetical protein